MTLVPDASAVASSLFADEQSSRADEVLLGLRGGSAVVPAYWPFEVANLLLVGLRRGRVSEADVAEAIETLRLLPILVDRASAVHTMMATVRLAQTHSLGAYDAGYLELAVRCGGTLASKDRALVQAAARAGAAVIDLNPPTSPSR